MVEALGKKNGWEVVTTYKASSFVGVDLAGFNVVIFNNNCGNKGAIQHPGIESFSGEIARFRPLDNQVLAEVAKYLRQTYLSE
jgi:hypothetical protein